LKGTDGKKFLSSRTERLAWVAFQPSDVLRANPGGNSLLLKCNDKELFFLPNHSNGMMDWVTRLKAKFRVDKRRGYKPHEQILA
jgi:hypothetical protein